MKLIFMTALLFPAFAMAEQTIECKPATKNSMITKVVLTGIEIESVEMQLWNSAGLILKTTAAENVDVSETSYYSEAADVNVYFSSVDMQEKGKAEGEIQMSATSNKIQSFPARCKSK